MKKTRGAKRKARVIDDASSSSSDMEDGFVKRAVDPSFYLVLTANGRVPYVIS